MRHVVTACKRHAPDKVYMAQLYPVCQESEYKSGDNLLTFKKCMRGRKTMLKKHMQTTGGVLILGDQTTQLRLHSDESNQEYFTLEEL